MHDAMNLLLGKKIGSGTTREVYEYAPDPDNWVIKVELGAGMFQNVIEFSTWNDVREGPIAKYFAVVKHISTYGCWLIMERTSTPPKNYKWPVKMPAMLTDFKRTNYGLTSKGKLVCHDYGTHLGTYNSGQSPRLRKANWWDSEDR